MSSDPKAKVSLTINGIPLRVAPGTTVLDAAQQNDVYIPTLCSHPLLRPEGVCRLCLVEVEGARGLSASCILPAEEGMIVRTDTPELREMRREILSLTLSEHPYTCLVCDRRSRCDEWQTTIRKAGVTTGCENCPKNGQCEIQTLVEKVGLTQMPYPIAYRGLAVEKGDPFFDRDYNLCVLCGRCVRACQEVRHTNTLGFLLRGPESRVGAAPGFSHVELDCEFCGACVDVCPTGALFDKRTKWEGAPDTVTPTVCPYCSVGCRMELWIKGGKVIGVRPAPGGPPNTGQACVRGRFGLVDLVHGAGRLAMPLVRRDGRLVEVDWEEALALAAEMLSAHRGDSFALLGSPHLTSESAFVLGRFAREAMQSRNIDCASAFPRHARAAELHEAILASPRASIPSIRDAKCILVIGANPRLSHPVVAVYLRQAMRMGGAKLIVFDPRETELARRAHLWLRPSPGSDAELLEALANPRKRPTGKTAEALRLLRENSPAVIIYGSGITYYPEAADALRAIQRLADRLDPPAGIIPLLGASNTLGVLQAGLIAGPDDRNYEEIVSRMAAGSIKALYAAGEVPPLPALSSLELLIVQDLFLAPHLKDRAHIVLPAAGFAEAAGTLTNLEGRDQILAEVLPPTGQARPDWLIAAQIAQHMGSAGFKYSSVEEIRHELEAFRTTGGAQGKKKSGRKPTPRHSPRASFLLLTERNAFAYRGFSLTRNVLGMDEVKTDENIVVLHPQDADRLGIAEGGRIRITSAHGADTKVAHRSTEVLPGTVFASINTLQGSPIFPGGTPAEKCIGVELEKQDGKS